MGKIFFVKPVGKSPKQPGHCQVSFRPAVVSSGIDDKGRSFREHYISGPKVTVDQNRWHFGNIYFELSAQQIQGSTVTGGNQTIVPCPTRLDLESTGYEKFHAIAAPQQPEKPAVLTMMMVPSEKTVSCSVPFSWAT